MVTKINSREASYTFEKVKDGEAFIHCQDDVRSIYIKTDRCHAIQLPGQLNVVFQPNDIAYRVSIDSIEVTVQ